MNAEPRPSLDVSPSGLAVLDRALWQRFLDAEDADTFVMAWLALQCAYIAGVTAGVVVLGEPDNGPFLPVAVWPPDTNTPPDLSAAAEAAMQRRQGTVVASANPPGSRSLAIPIQVGGRLHGVAGIAIAGEGEPAGAALRKMQWGAGWIEALVRRGELDQSTHLRERAALAVDLLASLLEHRKFDAAASALATELAGRFDCDLVALGLVRRRRCRVVTMSHASDFGRRLSLARDIALAMDEACDQNAVIVYPRQEGWDYNVTRAHADLAGAHGKGSILTIPLRTDEDTIGAVLLQRPADRPFDPETVELVDAAAGVIGPVLKDRHANDLFLIGIVFERLTTQLVRLFGPRYFGRKLATVGFALLVTFFAIARTDYSVTSGAVIEAQIQRTISAPFASYVAAEYARAGALVEAGELLASLDDQDLVLEQMRWTTARSQRTTEYDRALAQRDRAEAAIIRSQIEQAEAQLALISEQLSRTRIMAPFDGVVVEGDLSQRVGASIERGETLFVIAPLDAWRVALEVDEHDIGEIAEGLQGTLLLGAMPETTFRYTVTRVTPVARQAEGRNFFRAEAVLEGDFSRLRPSMAGVAKTDVGERLLIQVWSRPIIDWARLAAWRWIP